MNHKETMKKAIEIVTELKDEMPTIFDDYLKFGPAECYGMVACLFIEANKRGGFENTKEPVQQPKAEPRFTAEDQVVSEGQARMLFAIARENKWVSEKHDGKLDWTFLNMLTQQSFGVRSYKDIAKDDFNKAKAALEKGPASFVGR